MIHTVKRMEEEQKRKRLPADEIYKLIFNELGHTSLMTPQGLAKATGMQKQTIDLYVGRILYIQKQPKLKLIRTKNEEFLRFEKVEQE